MSGDLDFRASVMIKAAMTSNAAPAVHVDACQALLSPDWFDGYFGGMKVEFEEQPVSILSKPGVGVCLMVQWKKHPAFKGKWPEVDMDLPSTRHLVQELADRGTNYRAFFNFGAFTATWQFVEIKDMEAFIDGDKHNGMIDKDLRPESAETVPINSFGYIESVI